jgi:asparagine synthase (glutamine-hydrolysing)
VNPYLPAEVLWRQKEQFSDGVGYDWVDGLKAHAEEEVSDADFAKRAERFPFNPPDTKEYYLLRSMFEEMYPEPSALATVPFGKSIACSTPEAISWDPKWATTTGDISGRAVDVHDSSEGFSLQDAAAAPKVPATAAAGWDAAGRVRTAARGGAAPPPQAVPLRLRPASGLRVTRGLPARAPPAGRGPAGRASRAPLMALAPGFCCAL